MLSGVVAVGCLLAAVRSACGVEEARRFLEALRDPQGQYRYFDTALEYLETIRNSPLVDQEFKDVIDYEAGVTLRLWSETVSDTSIREKQLEQAQQRFERFLAEHPTHVMGPEANDELAKVLRWRGRIKLRQAAEASATAAAKTRLPVEARRLFGEAEKVLSSLDAQLLEEYRKIPEVIQRGQTQQIERRDALRGSLLQTRLALAEVVEDLAKTHPADSREYADALTAAAARYQEMYAKYERYLAGLYARLGEGRCYKELGKTDEACKVFEGLLTQPSEPQEFRVLRNKALALLLETALTPGTELGQSQKALDEAQKWEKAVRGNEESSPEGLAIKYLSGEAALAYAQTLKGQPRAEERNRLLAYAGRQFDFVAGFSGEYQRKAREAAGRPELVGEKVEPAEPTDFAAACDRAQAALYRSQGPDLEQDEIAAARQEAIDYYRTAILLRTAEVTAEEINLVRYRLAWLYYMSGDAYEAAVIGEFLARRYPNDPAGREGARIALAAYVGLLGSAPPEQRQFLSERVNDVAGYVTKQWPSEPLADEARMTLIRVALEGGDFQQAEEMLQKVPADSPRRGQLELAMGQRLWAMYLQDAREPEEQRPSQESLDGMVLRAKKTLEDGIARMRQSVDQQGGVDQTLAAAALSLAQIHVGEGEPEKALGWLEDPTIGALRLVATEHPVAGEGNFAEETYKAALRAYVATQQVDKAREAMKHLEELTEKDGDAEAGKRLTRIYISLGRELQEQLERLRNQQKADQLQKVSEAFGAFLDRIRQGEGNTFNSLGWVAETFWRLGKGFDPAGEGPLVPEAADYYQKAADTYRRILEQCGEKDFGAPEGAQTGVKIRLARCLRRLGQEDPAKFDQAMDLLVEILRDRSTMIDAQIEAAYVYQARGELDPRYYPLAIGGGQRIQKEDGSVEKLVWGWGRIANLVARSPQHESILHQSRYNLAQCRLKMALSKRGKERDDLLQQAEKDIRDVFRLYPGMGRGMSLEPGDKDWYEKYDELLKSIQNLRGTTPSGLKGLEAERRPAA